MSQTDVTVTLDDRVRLFSTVLAATNYPQQAQERKRYRAHPHARATLKHLADNGFDNHVAVTGMQHMLDRGVTLEQIFGVAMACDFPSMTYRGDMPPWLPVDWTKQVGKFYVDADVKGWWTSTPHDKAWEDALEQTQKIFSNVSFKTFLKPFFGDIQEELVVMPNVGYPAEAEVGLRTENKLISIVPPPLAWGESNPWPFDEETNLTISYRAALAQYCRVLLEEFLANNPEKVAEAARKDLPVTGELRARYQTWTEQFTALFISGVVSVYLEDHFSKPEADAFELMERKVRGMTLLGATISVMRRYISEYGKRYNSLADFLSIFPTQLRVAKTIVGR
jgi:hypothetical protein